SYDRGMQIASRSIEIIPFPPLTSHPQDQTQAPAEVSNRQARLLKKAVLPIQPAQSCFPALLQWPSSAGMDLPLLAPQRSVIAALLHEPACAIAPRASQPLSPDAAPFAGRSPDECCSHPVRLAFPAPTPGDRI